jgi:hypothetical protein
MFPFHEVQKCRNSTVKGRHGSTKKWLKRWNVGITRWKFLNHLQGRHTLEMKYQIPSIVNIGRLYIKHTGGLVSFLLLQDCSFVTEISRSRDCHSICWCLLWMYLGPRPPLDKFLRTAFPISENRQLFNMPRVMQKARIAPVSDIIVICSWTMNS